MKFLIILASILAVEAGVTKRGCNSVNVKGKYYDRQILKANITLPFQLAVDYKTDTLFFSYSVNKTEYKSARLDLKTNEFRDIDIPNGLTHAVDVENSLLYVGTIDGIYVYNIDTDQSEFYGAKGHIISALFFKDGELYYSKYPEGIVYTLSNGEPNKFKYLENTKVNYFVLLEDKVFFSNDTGLFKLKIDSGEAVLYKSFPYFFDLRALTLDVNGNIYAGIRDGIYSVEKDKVDVDLILAIRDVFGVAIDSNNNIIYADDNSVVRLIPSRNKNC